MVISSLISTRSELEVRFDATDIVAEIDEIKSLIGFLDRFSFHLMPPRESQGGFWAQRYIDRRSDKVRIAHIVVESDAHIVGAHVLKFRTHGEPRQDAITERRSES